MNLSGYEQEVGINLNADEDVQQFTVPILHGFRKKDALVREFPDFFRIKRQTEISKTYEVSKRLVRIGKPRELSSEQKHNLKKMRDMKRKKRSNDKAF